MFESISILFILETNADIAEARAGIKQRPYNRELKALHSDLLMQIGTEKNNVSRKLEFLENALRAAK